jgi:hypothetical protein
MNVFLIYIPITLPTFAKKNPNEKIHMIPTMPRIVKLAEKLSVTKLFPFMRREKIFQDVRVRLENISSIKSTGTTESAPAKIPIAKRRAPRGELFIYENIYPQRSMGKKTIRAIIMIEINFMIVFYYNNLLKFYFFRNISYLPN